jgi:hypothetical protein
LAHFGIGESGISQASRRVNDKIRRDKKLKRNVTLRKENFSIYDISRALDTEGHKISPVNVSLILKEEGFAKLPRRRDEERPPGPRPTVAAVADVRCLDLAPRQFRTKFGGLFLFLPFRLGDVRELCTFCCNKSISPYFTDVPLSK